jgi:hypothetical protein
MSSSDLVVIREEPMPSTMPTYFVEDETIYVASSSSVDPLEGVHSSSVDLIEDAHSSSIVKKLRTDTIHVPLNPVFLVEETSFNQQTAIDVTSCHQVNFEKQTRCIQQDAIDVPIQPDHTEPKTNTHHTRTVYIQSKMDQHMKENIQQPNEGVKRAEETILLSTAANRSVRTETVYVSTPLNKLDTETVYIKTAPLKRHHESIYVQQSEGQTGATAGSTSGEPQVAGASDVTGLASNKATTSAQGALNGSSLNNNTNMTFA